MTTGFGAFIHTSPLSSNHHDPEVTLASNCIRQVFGPTVQTVVDALQLRGGKSTLPQLISSIRKLCRRVINEERERLVKSCAKYKIHRARGPASSGYVVDKSSIQSSLMICIQHQIVRVHLDGTKPPCYELVLSQARLLTRFPRIIEYTSRALDENAAALIEVLLLHGRRGTVDAVVATVNLLEEKQSLGDTIPSSARYTQRQTVVECFRRLVVGGFIQMVSPLDLNSKDDAEREFSDIPSIVKEEAQAQMGAKPPDMFETVEDPAVVQLLSNMPYRATLPRQALWRVSFDMYHKSIRSFCLGRLVRERFGHKVQAGGSIVTAALKLAANKEHAQKITDPDTRSIFTPTEIVQFLPKAVQQSLEKKPGGLVKNLTNSLVDLSKVTYPSVIQEVESVESNNLGAFMVNMASLVEHLQNRVIHQMMYDSHSEHAARIVSILRSFGYLEADTIAEKAMMPVKDTRTVLHQLYRQHYITLLTLNPSKQYNPSSLIYLWTVIPSKILEVARKNVCLAMTNLRLRRQHEMEEGKEWIERAEEAGAIDENEHESDKVNYNKFCQGLERIDTGLTQLDETMMVLFDF